jgi:hypothetical protein
MRGIFAKKKAFVLVLQGVTTSDTTPAKAKIPCSAVNQLFQPILELGSLLPEV